MGTLAFPSKNISAEPYMHIHYAPIPELYSETRLLLAAGSRGRVSAARRFEYWIAGTGSRRGIVDRFCGGECPLFFFSSWGSEEGVGEGS